MIDPMELFSLPARDPATGRIGVPAALFAFSGPFTTDDMPVWLYDAEDAAAGLEPWRLVAGYDELRDLNPDGQHVFEFGRTGERLLMPDAMVYISERDFERLTVEDLSRAVREAARLLESYVTAGLLTREGKVERLLALGCAEAAYKVMMGGDPNAC